MLITRELLTTLHMHDEILTCKCDGDNPCPGCEAKGDQCMTYAKTFLLELLGKDLQQHPERVCELFNYVHHIHILSHAGDEH